MKEDLSRVRELARRIRSIGVTDLRPGLLPGSKAVVAGLNDLRRHPIGPACSKRWPMTKTLSLFFDFSRNAWYLPDPPYTPTCAGLLNKAIYSACV